MVGKNGAPAPVPMQLIPLGRRAREAADREKAEAAAKERAERGTKRKREALAQKKTQTRSNLRRLVDALRVVFPEGSKCDTLPSAHSVSLICRLLEEIRPEDVGLRPDGARYFQELDERGARGTPAITTKNLYECDTFTVAAFLLSPGKVMPLHDHPRMTVFSKILMGSAHVTSYDWVQPSLCLDRRWLLAQKVLDKEFTPESGAWALYPDTGGNVHRLAAGADGPCAFIDVLSPPYGSPLQQIGGSFYEDMPFTKIHPAVPNQISEEQKGKLAWLQQIGVPKDLNLITLQNRGPGSQ